MSRRRPAPHLDCGDYSHYKKSYGAKGDDGADGTDLKLLLKDIRFSTENEAGLEFADILTNAIRRTLTGNLQNHGWRNIHKVMIHRREDAYIQFVLFGADEDVVRDANYANVVKQGFRHGGKSMLTPYNLRLIEKDETADREAARSTG